MRHSSSTLEAFHRLSARNRDAIEATRNCGCFYCLKLFEASAVKDWAPESDGKEVTALCPHCGVDSVLPAREGQALDLEMLRAMHVYWFERSVHVAEHPNFLQRLRIQAEPMLRRLTWDLWESRRTRS